MKPILFDGILLSYLGYLGWSFLGGRNDYAFIIVIFCLLGAIALNRSSVTTVGKKIFNPRGRVYPLWQTFWGWTLIISFTVTFYVGLRLTHFSWREITNSEGFHGAVRLLQGIINPNFQILPKAITAIIETIYIAFVATALAVPAAFLLSFFCARNIMDKSILTLTIYHLLRGFFNILRSVEPFIWAIIFSVWVGIGPFAGMLALMIHTVASLAKQYSEQIECVENGPIEGIISTGANYIQILWFGIVPQIVLPFVAFTIYRWDINVRMATVIGLVGGGGIGNLLIQYQGIAMWEEVGCIVLVIVLVVWFMDTASSYIREAMK